MQLRILHVHVHCPVLYTVELSIVDIRTYAIGTHLAVLYREVAYFRGRVVCNSMLPGLLTVSSLYREVSSIQSVL